MSRLGHAGALALALLLGDDRGAPMAATSEPRAHDRGHETLSGGRFTPGVFDQWNEERRLRFGYGMTADVDAAGYWYRRAAEAGDPRAAYNWGLMLKRGQGTEVDLPEALRWLSAAADRRILDAHYVLGNMYRLGHGVPRSTRRAAALYRVAAEGGQANAQHALGNSYANGFGGVRDLVIAFKWWRLAADKGNPLAQNAVAEAKRLMTLDQVRRGENLAERWRADRARE